MLEDAALWQEFAAESEEHLDTLEGLLGRPETLDAAAVNTLFRAFHSLKGMSGALGAPGMMDLAHACEDFLGLARSGKRPVASAAAALLAAVDALRVQRQAVIATRQDAPAPVALLARLRHLLSADEGPATPPPAAAPVGGPAPATPGLPGLDVPPDRIAEVLARIGAAVPLLVTLATAHDPAAVTEAGQVAAFARQSGLPRLAGTLAALQAASGGLAALECLGLLGRQLALLASAAGEAPPSGGLAPGLAGQLAAPLAGLAVEVEALVAGAAHPGAVAAAARSLAAVAAAIGLDGLENLLLCIEDLAARDADPDAAAAIAAQGPALAERLRAAAEGGAAGMRRVLLPDPVAHPPEPHLPADFAATLSLDARHRLAAALESGQALFRLRLALGRSTAIESALGEALREAATVLGSRALPDVTPPQIETLLASAQSLPSLQAALAAVDPDREVVLALGPAEVAAEAEATAAGATLTMRVRQETIDTIIGLRAEVSAGALALSETVRESRPRDIAARLMTLEHGLGGDAARELRGVADMLQRFLDGLDAAESRVGAAVRRLDEAVMELRVVPIGTLFARLPRVVRAVAQASGKTVELTIEGQEVAIDRSLVELLADPLLHLLRNAVDHGVEAPEARLAAGKPPGAVLRVAAARQSGQVRITITDDGRGIDRARVLAKAVERGLVGAAAAARLADAETYAFLFHPGFSTAATITETSGRGVGLDVVKHAVRRAGGTVEVESTPGKGTCFSLLLPLTAAVQPVLLMEVGGHAYAVPANRVEAVLGAGEAPGCEVRAVAAMLGLPAEPPGGIVVVRSSGQRLGLAVGKVLRRTDLLLRSVHPALAALPGLSGVGVLGNGQPVVVLEPDGLP